MLCSWIAAPERRRDWSNSVVSGAEIDGTLAVTADVIGRATGAVWDGLPLRLDACALSGERRQCEHACTGVAVLVRAHCIRRRVALRCRGTADVARVQRRGGCGEGSVRTGEWRPNCHACRRRCLRCSDGHLLGRLVVERLPMASDLDTDRDGDLCSHRRTPRTCPPVVPDPAGLEPLEPW